MAVLVFKSVKRDLHMDLLRSNRDPAQRESDRGLLCSIYFRED
jgi:hypothetical protein